MGRDAGGQKSKALPARVKRESEGGRTTWGARKREDSQARVKKESEG